MKKLIFSLLLTIGSLATTHAQTKSQVWKDFSASMQDFVPMLNELNGTPDQLEENAQALAEIYGSPEYFIRNNKQMDSFAQWIEDYCKEDLQGELLMHRVIADEETLQKVDSENESDRRYKIELTWQRITYHQAQTANLPDERLTFIFVWNGENQYVSIVGIEGDIRPLPENLKRKTEWLKQVVGYIENENGEKALEILLPMVQNEDVVATRLLAKMYTDGLGLAKDEKKGFKYWKKVAETGDAMSQHKVGECYQYGRGINKNGDEAVKWYTLAAEQGYKEAQYDLGNCFDKGIGVNQNKMEAFRWYEKAARQGYADAMVNVGYSYLNGEGVTKDDSKAVEWLRKAADKGQPTAQRNLGICYANGYGVAQDYTKAYEWYMKAAEQGMPEAYFNIGMMYHDGKGVPKDYDKAAHWLLQAAEKGLSHAQYIIGAYFHYGIGVLQDSNKAKYWYTKAAEQGITEAVDELTELKNNGPK